MHEVKMFFLKRPVLSAVTILFIIYLFSQLLTESAPVVEPEKDDNQPIKELVEKECKKDDMRVIYQLEGKEIIGADCIDDDGVLHPVDITSL